MTQKKVAVAGSAVAGICNGHSSPRAWSGSVLSGSSLLTSDGAHVSSIGDIGTCSCGHTFRISTASGARLLTPAGTPAAVEGDSVEVIDGGGTVIGSGTIQPGSATLSVEVP